MNRVFTSPKRQRRRSSARRSSFGRRVGLFESLESRRLLAIAIDVGTHYLLPNTPGQEIDIYATGLPEDRVAGFNTRAQLGDGNGPLVEPIFTALKYENSIWGTLQQTATGGPVNGFSMVAQGSITLDTAGQNVVANGLTVTLVIDTTGFSEGTFDLKFSDTVIGAPSVFIRNGGNNFPVAITNGSIIVGGPSETLSIAASDSQKPEGDAGTTPFTFTVTRTGEISGTTSVDYAVTGSGSQPADGDDFGGTLPSGTVEFAADETEKLITIDVSGDSLIEPDDQFTVTLLNPSGTATIEEAAALGLIQNDDATMIAIAASDAVKAEGSSGTTEFTFVVSRAGDTSRSDTVDFAVTGVGDDSANVDDFGGAFPSGTVSFEPGQTARTITIAVLGDSIVEPDEGFQVTLSNASAPAVLGTTIANGVIQNDDSTILSIAASDAVKVEGSSGTSGFTFTVTRTGDTSRTDTVNYTVDGLGANPADATDFGGEFPSGTVTFDPGESIKVITVNVVGDTTLEPDESFRVTLTDASLPAILGNASADGTILNDDVTLLSIAAVEAVRPEGDSGVSGFTFRVTRTGDTSRTDTVAYNVAGNGSSPADATDFGGTFPGGVLTFDPGETEKVVTISVSGDSEVEPNEGFRVELTDVSAPANLGTTFAEGVIENDDSTLISIAADDAVKPEGSSGTSAFTFIVSRAGDTSRVDTVEFTVMGVGDNPATASDFGGSFPSGTVSFAVGVTSRTVTIDVAGDTIIEADEHFRVTLTNASDPVVLGTAVADGIIQNDDSTVISFTATDAVKLEGTGVPADFIFTVSRSGDTSRTDTVDYTVAGIGEQPADPVDFGGAFPSGTISFGPDETDKTIVIPVSPDSILEPDEAFRLTLSGVSGPATLGTNIADGTILNDDSTRFGIAAADAVKAEGSSGETAFTFTVTRAGDTSRIDTVDFAVVGTGDKPANAADFGGALPSGTLSFAAGETDKTIVLSVVGDTVLEHDESFRVSLSNASAPAVITSSEADGVIQNDDSSPLGVTIDVGTHTLLPDTPGQVIPIRAVGSLVAAITGLNVRSQIGDGLGPLIEPTFADLTYEGTIWDGLSTSVAGGPVSGALMVAQGSVTLESAGTQVDSDGVVVNLVIDTTGISFGQYDLKLSDTIIGADTVFIGNGGADIPIEIFNGSIIVGATGSTLSIEATQTDLPEADAGTTSHIFTVTRTGDLSVGTTVDYRVVGSGPNQADAADFGGTLPSGTLTFAADVSSKTIIVDVTGDTTIEPDEGFTVELLNPAGQVILNPASADGVIQNDEAYLDFGDATATYPVRLSQNGARHIVGPLFLGNSVDAELDAIASADADSDAHDDGVIMLVKAIVSPQSDTVSSVSIDASLAGKIDAWVDFNADGVWDDPGEKIFSSLSIPAGSTTLPFTIPAGAAVGETMARFRFSSAGGLSPRGEAPDGEVEDYRLNLESAANSHVRFVSVDPGSATIESTNSDIVIREADLVVFRGPANQLSIVDFVGTSGSDTLELAVSATTFGGSIQIDTGGGTDTVLLAAEIDELDIRDGSNHALRGVEVIDLRNDTAQTLTLSKQAIATVPDAGQVLTVLADRRDTLQIVDGDFAVVDSLIEDDQFYVLAQSDDTTLRIGGRNWTHPLSPMDVDNSGGLEPLDALLVINQLYRREFLRDGSDELMHPRELDGSFPMRFFDTSGDGLLTPIDILLVLNALYKQSAGTLNANAAAGELMPQPITATKPLDRERWSEHPIETFASETPLVLGVTDNVATEGRVTRTPTEIATPTEQETEEAIDLALASLYPINKDKR